MSPVGPSHSTPPSSELKIWTRDLHCRKRQLSPSSGSDMEEALDSAMSSSEHKVEQAGCSHSRTTMTHSRLSSSESSDDDTMEIQGWRGERFLREAFIQSQVCDVYRRLYVNIIVLLPSCIAN